MNTPNTERSRVAVVGAGPGGLAAAMILAHRGFEVDVYEAKGHVGGRNASLQLGPYKFDVGPTFLMMRHILDEVFEEAGAEAADYLDFVHLDPMYRLQFADFALACSPDRDKTKAAIRSVRPGLEKGFDTFLENEAKRFNYMAPCLQQPYGTVGSLVSSNVRRAMPHLSIGKTVYQVLRKYFPDDQLALAFSFQTKYLGMSAWECPGAFAMLAYIEYAFGVYHITGGLSEISQAMAKRAEECGARIHLSTPVERIVVENGAAAGVQLAGGERVGYDDVIVNADFGHTAKNLVDAADLRKWKPAKLDKMRLSCSTFMLYLGLDKVYDLPHHCIVMAEDYEANVEDIFNRKRLSEDTSFYIRNASVTDPTLAPEGHSAVYVLVPVPNLRADIDWDTERETMRRRTLDTIQRRLGIDDLEQHIVEEHVIAPPEWRDDYMVFEGATFNLAHTLGQMLYFRPHNRFEDFKRCYLTGGGTHPGSGVPTILESGRIAANLVCKDRGVAYESKNVHV